MKIESKIKEILEAGTFEGNKYFLPQIQLDRKDYVKCNEVLNTIGMIWTKWQKAHIGDGENLEETFRAILETWEVETLKEYRDRFQFFPTPKELAEYVVELAEISNGLEILEPSAGRGAIIEEILQETWPKYISALELDPKNIEILEEKYSRLSNIIQSDFLEYKELKYDRIIMNPPYTKKQDLFHIKHAISLLKDWWRLVWLMSRGILFRDEYKELKDDILKNWYIEEVPEWTFKESWTMIWTCIIVYNK